MKTQRSPQKKKKTLKSHLQNNKFLTKQQKKQKHTKKKKQIRIQPQALNLIFSKKEKEKGLKLPALKKQLWESQWSTQVS